MKIFSFIFIVIGIFLFNAGLVYFLWNWLMPALFGLAEISFAQAMGLYALVNILVGKGARTEMKS